VTTQPCLSQTATKFTADLARYFNHHNIDSVEGLYTVSDDWTITPSSSPISGSREHKIRDHWAKVAVIRDSTSLTRDYFELTIEAPNYKEGELRAEYLQTKQNPGLFISKQMNFDKTKMETMVFYFEGETLTATYEYRDGENAVKLTRTYLKYYPRR
jgi:hypothetical protein